MQRVRRRNGAALQAATCACAVCAAARDISASRRRIATEAVRSDDEVDADEEDDDADADDDADNDVDKEEGKEAGGGDDKVAGGDVEDRRGDVEFKVA